MVIYNGPIERSGNYAFLNLLRYVGVNITEEEMDKLPDFKSMQMAEHHLKKKMKQLKHIRDAKAIDKWLSVGQLTICYSNCYNPKLSKNTHQFFNGKEKIFFLIVQDLGDIWKILPAFGTEHGDYGYEYMNKKDFPSVMQYRRIVP